MDYTFGEEPPSGGKAGGASGRSTGGADAARAGAFSSGPTNEKRGSGRGLAFLRLLRVSSVDEKRLSQIATSWVPAFTRRHLVATSRLCSFHYRETEGEVRDL